MMMGFLPILSDSQPKKYESRRGQRECNRGEDVGGRAIDPQHPFEKEQCVELSRVPHHRLTHHRAGQRDDDDFQIAPAAEGLRKRRLRRGPAALHPEEHRALGELQAYPHGYGEQDDGHQEGNAPAPCLEGILAHVGARAYDHQQRGEQSQGRRRLNPAGVQPAFSRRCEFGDVGSRAPVLAAQGKALQQAQRQQQDGRGHADAGIARQQAHGRRWNRP